MNFNLFNLQNAFMKIGCITKIRYLVITGYLFKKKNKTVKCE